jgi:glutathione S-transferase
MKKEPFEFICINPMKGENRTNEYRSKFPLGLIPAIEDDPGDGKTLALSESSAIMIYLCDKHKWNDFYPSINRNSDGAPNIRRRALINEYISHHNESTRMMTRKVIQPGLTGLFIAEGNLLSGRRHSLSRSPEDVIKLKSTIRDVAKRFQHKFLTREEKSDFIVGNTVTIADLLAYPDLAQIPQILGIDYGEWPELEELRKWLDRMAKLPYHDDVHHTAMKLGKIYQSKL